MRSSILYLLGTVLLLGSCATVPVRDSADATSDRASPIAGSGAMKGPTEVGPASDYFVEYPTLKEYGLTILEAPKQNIVAAETLIVVSSDQDIELLAMLFRPDSNSSIVGMTNVEKDCQTWRCTVKFPETGEFRVFIAARRPNDPGTHYTGVAEWRLRAEVQPEKLAAKTTIESVRAELNTALAGGRVPEIRAWLAACERQNPTEKALSMAALKSVLFETDRARLPEVFGLLEAAGLDPNMTDEEGVPVLFSTVWNDRIDVAAWLLGIGADVNARSNWGGTVLHSISVPMDNPVEAHTDWARLFLEHGVELDARDSHESTALCYAALSDRQHALVVFLVENGADFNLGDEEGNAPLSHATQHECKQNSAFLKSKRARLYSYKFPVNNDAPPCRAVIEGDVAALASLPREEFSKMIARTSLFVPATALHLAAEQGSLRSLQALCARDVDWNVPDRYGRSPLQLAVMADRADVVLLLLANGADPNFASNHLSTPFSVACATNPAIARQMLATGFVPKGETVAKAAIGSENLDLVKALGGKVEWSSEDLDFASDLGLVEITEVLSSLVQHETKNPSQLIVNAQENRRRLDEYMRQVSRLFQAPRRSGGIAGKRGTFPYVLESWSPWLKSDKVNLADYPVGVYVPDSYDGRQPFGLVVSMTNAKSSSPYPRDFTQTLDRHRLIWVGFDPYNHVPDVTAFCLAIVYNMLGYFNIDQSRIYIGGFSLGGQLTSHVLRRQPWVFKGAFFINIGFSSLALKQPQLGYLRNHVPMVFVLGDYDYNRLSTYSGYDKLLSTGHRNVYYVHEPMMGHRLISAARFEKAVSLLETSRK